MASSMNVFKKWLAVIFLYIGIFGTNAEDVHPHDVDVKKIMRTYGRYTSMTLYKAADFWMGINDPSSETGEYPPRVGHTKSFLMDRYPVTNAHFWEFSSKKRKYQTEPVKQGYSWVFDQLVSQATKSNMSVPGADNWLAVKRANWEHPEGHDSLISKRWTHPVVHVSHRDANIYCKWRGKRLPTEAEWERAARGTHLHTILQYPWGEKWQSKRMNIWQGPSIKKNYLTDGYMGTSPVDAFKAQTDLGMFDMLGNVWEWTDTPYYQPYVPYDMQEVQMILKGGSFVDDRRGKINYAIRTAQRMPQTPEYTANNVGFRCVKDAPQHDPDFAKVRQERIDRFNIRQEAMRKDEL